MQIKGQIEPINTKGSEMVEHVVTTSKSKKVMPQIEVILESRSWIPKSPPMVLRLRAKSDVEK